MTRFLPYALLALILTASSAHAAEGSALLSPNPGLFIWVLLIFGALMTILRKYAFGPLTEAVRSREQALQEMIESARRDRDEASALLAQQRSQLDGARAEADKLIVEGRNAGEKLRSIMLEETRQQQQEMLERARREIENEKDRAIAQLRAEAVDLALAGASKVIEQNMDSAANRKLVESFLGSLSSAPAGR